MTVWLIPLISCGVGVVLVGIWVWRFAAAVFPCGAPYVWISVCERRQAPFRQGSREGAGSIVTMLKSERLMLLSQAGTAFKVAGDTGTVYDVLLCAQPACSCDAYKYRFARGGKAAVCKHLAFVLVKVLGMPANHYLLHQTAWLTWETAYWQARPRAALTAPRPVLELLGFVPPRVLDTDGVCPICRDPFEAGEATCRCAACQALFHTQCVSDYNKSQLPGQPLCAACRAQWSSEELRLVTEVKKGVPRVRIVGRAGSVSKKK
jgi:hypothetical protein